MANSSAAARRAKRFAKLLIEFRKQVHQTLASKSGVSLPPLSKRKLALLLGVSPTLISKYENAEIDPLDVHWGLMTQIAETLNLSLEEMQAIIDGKQKSIDWAKRSLQVVPKRQSA